MIRVTSNCGYDKAGFKWITIHLTDEDILLQLIISGISFHKKKRNGGVRYIYIIPVGKTTSKKKQRI